MTRHSRKEQPLFLTVVEIPDFDMTGMTLGEEKEKKKREM